jgi:hypothetical protein
MNQVEIQIIKPESIQAGIESRFYALRPVIVVPQLCGDEDVLADNPPSGKSRLQDLAHLALIPVSLRAIEMSKSGLQGGFGRGIHYSCVGNQGPKTERGYTAGSVVERYFRIPKI